jgi:hypothetical protein
MNFSGDDPNCEKLLSPNREFEIELKNLFEPLFFGSLPVLYISDGRENLL